MSCFFYELIVEKFQFLLTNDPPLRNLCVNAPSFTVLRTIVGIRPPRTVVAYTLDTHLQAQYLYRECPPEAPTVEPY